LNSKDLDQDDLRDSEARQRSVVSWAGGMSREETSSPMSEDSDYLKLGLIDLDVQHLQDSYSDSKRWSLALRPLVSKSHNSDRPIKKADIELKAKELRDQGRHLEAIEEYKNIAGIYSDPDAYYMLAVYHDPILATDHFTRLVGLTSELQVTKIAILCYLKVNKTRNDPAISLKISQLCLSDVINRRSINGYQVTGIRERTKSLNAAHLPAWEYVFNSATDGTFCRDALRSIVTASPMRGGVKLTVCESVMNLLYCDSDASQSTSRLWRDALRLKNLGTVTRLIDRMYLPETASQFYDLLNLRIYGDAGHVEKSYQRLLGLGTHTDISPYYRHLCWREASNNFFLGRGVEKNLDKAADFHISSVISSVSTKSRPVSLTLALHRILTKEKCKRERVPLLLFLDACKVDLDRYFDPQSFTNDVSTFVEELTQPAAQQNCPKEVIEKLREKKSIIIESHLLTSDLMIAAASYLPWFDGL
jgi:hypothetical protein